MRKSVEKKNFIVKPEERMVIAIADRIEFESIISEVKRKCKYDVLFVIASLLASSGNDISDFVVGEPIKGIAKCDIRDTFSEKTGKEIASSIVDKKYHFSMAKKYKKLHKIITEVANECEKLAKYHSNKVDNIKEDMERMYSGE